METNQKAADNAKHTGYRIYTNPDSTPRDFDAVCAFQVLEHVEKPKEFIDYLCSRLRAGGFLILAVPNCDAFMGDDTRLPLNMPPHHVSRWGESALLHLASIAPLQNLDMLKEPLPEKHVDWYLTSKLERIQAPKFVRIFVWRVLKPFLASLLRYKIFRSRISGHTIMAVYKKCDVAT